MSFILFQPEEQKKAIIIIMGFEHMVWLLMDITDDSYTNDDVHCARQNRGWTTVWKWKIQHSGIYMWTEFIIMCWCALCTVVGFVFVLYFEWIKLIKKKMLCISYIKNMCVRHWGLGWRMCELGNFFRLFFCILQEKNEGSYIQMTFKPKTK